MSAPSLPQGTNFDMPTFASQLVHRIAAGPREVPLTTKTSLFGCLSLSDQIRVIREAQRTCLSVVQRWMPNQTEDFYLDIIRFIVASGRADRTAVEAEVLQTYAAAKADATSRVLREVA